VQLRQNEKLQNNYAQELEQTVEERTFELQKTYKELKGAYTKITDSVQYAQRIQKSTLISPSEIEHYFKELFIVYSPKDVVSGDFYWFHEVKNEESNYLILAAVDCTGHGIPGAFMTIMGNDFLTEIVESRNIIQPNLILAELDKKITFTLQKETHMANTSDGMDIAIVAIDQTNKTLQYAGAKNPLWYVRDGQMNRVKATLHSIGYSDYFKNTEKVFQNNVIDIQAGDNFYIFSDGFQDQFGGEQDRKYMKKRFREFLQKNSSFSLHQQQTMLEAELKTWKKDNEQTDDILVIGFQYL
jgi:serine phosphatase RsbU (regulator of sigma subunit)